MPFKKSRHYLQHRHPEITDEMVEYVLAHHEPEDMAPDEFRPDRVRYWAFVPEAAHWVRVTTEADGEVVTAHFDRGYTRQRKRPR